METHKLAMDAAFLQEVVDFLDHGTPLTLSTPPPVINADCLSPVSLTFDQGDQNTVEAKVDSEILQPVLDRAARFRAKDAQRRRVYRKRQQEERDDLRRQSRELTAELSDLKKHRSIPSSTLKHSSPYLLAVWKALAMQQKEARQIAETKQRRLHESVAARAAVIKDLENFIRKRLASSRDATLNLSSGIPMSPRLTKREAFLYKTFVNQLDTLYVQTDRVMSDCGMNTKPGITLNFIPTLKSRGNTAYFEYVLKQRIPGDMQRTRLALWRFARMPHRQDDREVYKQSDRTIAVRFRVKGASTDSVSLFEHLVVRRYDERDRTVLVWRTLTEGEKSLNGLHSDKTGWCIIRPSKTGTIKETYVRQVPIHMAEVEFVQSAQAVDQFTIMTHRTTEEDGIEIARGLADTT